MSRAASPTAAFATTNVAKLRWIMRRHASELVGLSVALIGAVAAGWLAQQGGIAAIGGLWSLVTLVGLAIYLGTLCRSVLGVLGLRAGADRARGDQLLAELEVGALLIGALYLLLAISGGARSVIHPLVYALVSFLFIVHERRPVAIAWLSFVCLLEIWIGANTPKADATLIAYHLTLILFFAAGNALVLTTLMQRMRGEHGRRVSAELSRIRQEAHDFRLIASQLPLESRAARSREEEELRMTQGAVHAIHEQLYFNLDLLCAALGLHTCALLWVDDSAPRSSASSARWSPRLTIKELATSSEMVRDTPAIESLGVLATVVRDPKPLRLRSLGGKRVPPYYEGPEAITDICAVPMMEGQALRGLLCADRISDRPFSEVEESVLVKAASHVLRIIAQERAYVAVERGKYEQEQFYRASELLNEALTFSDVCDKTFAAIRAIAPSTLVVIAAYDAAARAHKVLAVDLDEQVAGDRAWSELREQLVERSFSDAGGLIASAVKTRHHMPANGDLGDPETVVFDAQTKLRKAKSVLILPLVRGENVVGTLTLASTRAGLFPPQMREMLRVISHQVGVSLQNARMYQVMEEKATTDGLTGLTNHRAFQERFEQLHALSERSERKFSVILTDIDHFKSVNDTYGHPVGDAVLKRVAAVFAARARKADIVARYGGEEFVIVLPETDSEGAELYANKLREEIGAAVMNSEHGSFNVTISMGIAEFPTDGRTRAELVEAADQALYYCKEHGRNCVTRYGKTR